MDIGSKDFSLYLDEWKTTVDCVNKPVTRSQAGPRADSVPLPK
jgi:hypothetical protein